MRGETQVMDSEPRTHAATPEAVSYSLATSWDDRLLDGVAALNAAPAARGRVTEVYGSHRQTIVGGGRPSYRLPEVSSGHFARHLAATQAAGLRFNYVLNAPDLGGRDADPAWVHGVIEDVGKLIGAGVHSLTIASEPLLRLARREFPGVRIHLSLIAGVDRVDEARRFEDLGVDVIILSPFTVNRDFATLRAIRAAVQCDLELYANIPCLDRCPMREPHYRLSARGSRLGERHYLDDDPFLRTCSHDYLSDPVEFLRSPFIRPEDVGVYRELGIDVIKLSDRTESTAFLLATARAYLDERFDGNLFDLIFRAGQKFRAGLGRQRDAAAGLPLPIRIDNQALSRLDFIGQITSLHEPELSAFYRHATQTAVQLPEASVLDGWRRLLQSQ